jgi:hypothetical protein
MDSVIHSIAVYGGANYGETPTKGHRRNFEGFEANAGHIHHAI